MKKFIFPGYVRKQIDERTFEVSLSSRTHCTVKCYLSDELFRKNIRPLVEDWVILKLDSDLKKIIIVR
jgi:translation initiation factor IF-1